MATIPSYRCGTFFSDNFAFLYFCQDSASIWLEIGVGTGKKLDKPLPILPSSHGRWDNQDPFGANVPDEDPNNTGNHFTFNPRFPGQYFDRETNLAYNYFRDYDPAAGRYIQSDPLGVSGGVNLYGYVNQNPLKNSDPYGLRTPVGVVIGGVCIVIEGIRSVMDVLELAEAIKIRAE